MEFDAIVSASKYGRHPALLYRSNLLEGRFIEFVYLNKSTDGRTKYYVCAACRKLRRTDKSVGPPPRVKVMNNKFMEDPEKPRHPHFCDFKTAAEALGQRERYSMYQEVRGTPRALKPPKRAFLDHLQELSERRDLSKEEAHEICSLIGGPRGYKAVRRNLQRNAVLRKMADDEYVWLEQDDFDYATDVTIIQTEVITKDRWTQTYDCDENDEHIIVD
ncbi:hypothetical protein AB6A40_003167 [Gnathostoma spinigerum]|uniref:RYYR-CCHC domain-containing protein n=1 Tax=Gnathostoma spinigerum TaxID=75299 RepID=A0ABD6E8V9_9BILA